MQLAPDTIDFSTLTPDEIARFLASHHLHLTVDEALTIQRRLLKRPPTFAECVLWSIQGSEHCSYKSSRKHLKQLLTDGPHVILGPKEDAGIVAVARDHQGLRYGVVMSHESHNHPSQIVPYEGAATGVGGNVRDVSCMGAEVIAVADSLRFGDIHRAKTHFIHEGVVSGIGGYGNPIGVPNIAGDLYYDEAYNDNCLVTVVTLGIVREDHIIHSYAPLFAKDKDYVFILVGKPTDNSGFGGASFASSTLHDADQERNKGAVQEPNAFLQRHLLKANNALFQILREKNLIDHVGFKDLGAGGIACASVELAEASGFGAEIDLECVKTSMPNLLPAVVLCSETQERFMWVVPKDLTDLILSHYNDTFALPSVSQGAAATVIGHIRQDGLYVVKDRGQTIVEAKASDVTKGILYDRPFEKIEKNLQEPQLPLPSNYNDVLLKLLSHENIASRAPVIETYDKQVQGRSIIEAGVADAGVLQPFNSDDYPAEIRIVGIALSLDHNPRYNKIDAYWGAVNAVFESVRNVVATGASPVALTDCLCFGNPENKEHMAEFVEAVRGIADASRAIHVKGEEDAGLPVISGNVSLYNESSNGAIPPSPMISCLGVLSDVSKAMTLALKKQNSLLFLVGERKNECGGSVYYQLHQALGAYLPRPDFAAFDREISTVLSAMEQGFVLSAHDISDGGIAVALAEMSFKNQIGIRVTIPGDLPLDRTLFGETGGFILEVSRDQSKAIQQHFKLHHVPLFALGETTKAACLKMNDVIDLDVSDAKHAFENGLREKLL